MTAAFLDCRRARIRRSTWAHRPVSSTVPPRVAQPAPRRRLACRWARDAQGRLACVWTLEPPLQRVGAADAA